MNKNQFDEAREIHNEIHAINCELKNWARITDKKYLGYCSRSSFGSTDSFSGLKTRISDSLFESFRESAINDLKLKIVELKERFEQL